MKFIYQHNFLPGKWTAFGLFSTSIMTIFIGLCFSKPNLPPPTTIIIPKSPTILPKLKLDCIVYLQNSGGRFGNRMFMLASAYGLARLHSCYLYVTQKILDELQPVFDLDLSPLLISSSIFDLIFKNSSKPINRLEKVVVCHYVTELTRPNAIPPRTIFEVKGFWQSYLHFAKYSDELRQRIFVASQPTLRKVSKFFTKFYKQKLGFIREFSLENRQLFRTQLTQSNETTWIGIHVRRSDFVARNFSSSDAYLLGAIEYYTVRYPNAYFIVASDDKFYCRNLFRSRSNVIVTPPSFSVGDDLIILSLCQHSIITGGTLGWWGGYLANGEVIHDKIYPSGCERREYYYPPWFLIDGNVRARENTDYIL